ncbi:MAG TPA: hypothetical protein DCG57_18780 [Candidatus Riflebacteria bacterium]|nr:hypothetical protein [Candidatus Riflebacteria bacterium]
MTDKKALDLWFIIMIIQRLCDMSDELPAFRILYAEENKCCQILLLNTLIIEFLQLKGVILDDPA